MKNDNSKYIDFLDQTCDDIFECMNAIMALSVTLSEAENSNLFIDKDVFMNIMDVSKHHSAANLLELIDSNLELFSREWPDGCEALHFLRSIVSCMSVAEKSNSERLSKLLNEGLMEVLNCNL